MRTRHHITSVCAGLPDPNPHLLGIIRDWARRRGRDLPAHWEMSRPDERFARFCPPRGRTHPLEFRTLESYRALIAEIGEQFQLFSGAGYTFSLWRGDGQPYRNSREMRADVRRNRRLFVYPTSGMPPDHPLAAWAAPGWSWNDVFRAVHDLVGHAATGFQFGPVGEENAFRFHATIHSPAAIPALVAETRLQNCWVNFGPHVRDAQGILIQHGEPGYIPPPTRPYATQKAFSPVAASVDCALWRSFLMDDFAEITQGCP
ncbi:MAG TPA: hypothetical protein VGQ49_13375 [Bryobacteraceae bacterium]|jgi:hypothetical protein|nr:hypothetical protein [Bryobacteraceae bacterium]